MRMIDMLSQVLNMATVECADGTCGDCFNCFKKRLYSYTFNKYQEDAGKTAMYPSLYQKQLDGTIVELDWVYPALKLAGEAGEVAEKFGKIIRDCNGVMSPEQKADMVKELGDVLWYLAAISSELGVTLEEVAFANIAKLASRKERGVIQGSGDNR